MGHEADDREELAEDDPGKILVRKKRLGKADDDPGPIHVHPKPALAGADEEVEP